MIRRPPRSTRTDTLFPYTTLFRSEELMAELDGISVEEYRREAELHTRLAKAGEKYRRAQPSEWPNLTFNWDFRPESQRFALDGMNLHEFRSEESRVGKECVSTCRSRGSP